MANLSISTLLIMGSLKKGMKRRQENHLSAQNNALTNRLGDDSQRNKVWQIDCQLIKKRSILDI